MNRSLLRKVARGIYAAIPMKGPMLSAVRRVWQPPASVYQHLHFKGPFTVSPDGGAPFTMMHHGSILENEVFWHGATGHEPLTLGLWTRLAGEARTVLDIGANTGYFSLLAAAMNPSAQVVAFEAVDRIGDKMEANVAANPGWDGRVRLVRVGASDHDGTATLFEPEIDHHTTAGIASAAYEAGVGIAKVEIPVRTLDSVDAERDLGAVDLVKIDVEGHEPEVLAGAAELLDAWRPTLIVEVLNDDLGARVQRVLDGRGYRYFSLDDVADRAVPLADIRRVGRNRNVLVCQPYVAERLGLGS